MEEARAVKEQGTMQIALISHDSKKELMLQFCIAYSSVLRNHRLFSTMFTSKMLNAKAKLKVQSFLSSLSGGVQQIAARVACNEIDLLIYFRDPNERTSGEGTEQELFRLCDAYSIPYATNIATAEVLIQGLRRGDFAWRNLLKADKNL